MLINFTSSQKAGSIVHIQNSKGKDILTFVPVKNYQSVAFSSPSRATSSTYDIYVGGSSTGAVTNGLYQNGTYTAGTKNNIFTISSITTNVGSGTR
ncbi:hypothetical protein HNV11_19930 [Spirosoma taeanense]|uniref:Uncharacterized protein n=1 Tax=Spirosoma taeanense TaxID=2735870 RepID=A0A6M5YBG2_9BACT|nr:hypothetical protein [Spirosoma taeanense]QJW91487.1 hypothetical protein HNV11_19930 [Spirosoma taeanense]